MYFANPHPFLARTDSNVDELNTHPRSKNNITRTTLFMMTSDVTRRLNAHTSPSVDDVKMTRVEDYVDKRKSIVLNLFFYT